MPSPIHFFKPQSGAADNATQIAQTLLGTDASLKDQERQIINDATRGANNIKDSAMLMLLVVATSIAMGVLAWAFLKSLEFATDFRIEHRFMYLLMPVVAVATAWLYKNHGLKSSRGNNLIIDSAFSQELVHARMAVLTFVCSTATHFVGGSVGREGAAVQIGGTLASNVSHFARLNKVDHHKLMLAGISAAFGGVFGAPVAGAFFGMEMCFIGKIDYTAAIYCLTGSFIGNAVARGLGATFEVFTIAIVPSFTWYSVFFTALAAVLFGLVAKAFAFSVHWMKDFYKRIFPNYLVAAGVAACVVLIAYAVFDAWDYAGLATWLSSSGFAGTTSIIDPIAKFVLTVLSLGAGFQGGEVTPLFGIGASLGGWIGQLTSLGPGFFAAMGMLGVFCGGLNVPITTIMLALDMFDGSAAPFFVITAFVSYLVSGHAGVYQAQRIITSKRRSLSFDQGATVAEAIEHHHSNISDPSPKSSDTLSQ